MDPAEAARINAIESKLAGIEATVGLTTPRVDRSVERIDNLVDRVSRIEERVAHLPTKGWGVGALVTLVALAGGLIAIAPALQRWAGTL